MQNLQWMVGRSKLFYSVFRRSSFHTFEAFYAREARDYMIIDLFLSCTMNHRNFIHRLATQDPPLPLRNNIVLIQHPVTVHSSVIATERYFLNLFYMTRVCLSVCVCHKPVLDLKGRTDRSDFQHGSFQSPILA